MRSYRYGLLHSCVNITILTIHIDLYLIRVFQRASRTDMNPHTSNIYVLIKNGFIATFINVNMLRYGFTV